MAILSGSIRLEFLDPHPDNVFPIMSNFCLKATMELTYSANGPTCWARYAITDGYHFYLRCWRAAVTRCAMRPKPLMPTFIGIFLSSLVAISKRFGCINPLPLLSRQKEVTPLLHAGIRHKTAIHGHSDARNKSRIRFINQPEQGPQQIPGLAKPPHGSMRNNFFRREVKVPSGFVSNSLFCWVKKKPGAMA